MIGKPRLSLERLSFRHGTCPDLPVFRAPAWLVLVFFPARPRLAWALLLNWVVWELLCACPGCLAAGHTIEPLRVGSQTGYPLGCPAAGWWWFRSARSGPSGLWSQSHLTFSDSATAGIPQLKASGCQGIPARAARGQACCSQTLGDSGAPGVWELKPQGSFRVCVCFICSEASAAAWRGMAGASHGDGVCRMLFLSQSRRGREQEGAFLLQRNITGQNKSSVY